MGCVDAPTHSDRPHSHSSPGYDRNLPNQPPTNSGTGLSSAFLTTICRPMVSRVFNEVRAWEQVHDWRYSAGVLLLPKVSLVSLVSSSSKLQEVNCGEPAMEGFQQGTPPHRREDIRQDTLHLQVYCLLAQSCKKPIVRSRPYCVRCGKPAMSR